VASGLANKEGRERFSPGKKSYTCKHDCLYSHLVGGQNQGRQKDERLWQDKLGVDGYTSAMTAGRPLLQRTDNWELPLKGHNSWRKRVRISSRHEVAQGAHKPLEENGEKVELHRVIRGPGGLVLYQLASMGGGVQTFW